MFSVTVYFSVRGLSPGKKNKKIIIAFLDQLLALKVMAVKYNQPK